MSPLIFFQCSPTCTLVLCTDSNLEKGSLVHVFKLSESSFFMLGADAFILEHQLICQASY